ncbi:hypothetical protein NE865_08762 [Phthorimaea operculella]|nr:hypothetical protein NE865_08762 [Phthorimaea operculella]
MPRPHIFVSFRVIDMKFEKCAHGVCFFYGRRPVLSMPFTRVWDSSCPREYDRWEADGVTWVIQDLPPDDDEEVLEMFEEHFIPDEALCTASGLLDDKLSVDSMLDFWRACLAKRMALACYAYKDGVKTLAALNCCLVACRDDDEEICKIEGELWQNVYNALHYVETKVNVFDLLNVDRVLIAMGLVVKKEYRGARLGSRLLAARKPLALSHGITATSTVFSGIASQKSAERAGFRTVAEVSFKELAESGLRYPSDKNRIVKLMVKTFDD